MNEKLEKDNCEKNKYVKPFLKWAGGKRQHLKDIYKRLPNEIMEEGIINSYIEPFVGGGSVYFFLWKKFNVRKVVLIDINKTLILTYKIIRDKPLELINELEKISKLFIKLEDLGKKEKFYYDVRDRFNADIQDFDFSNFNSNWISKAADFIFLNKTCYNGLFRENKKGEFNVPFGKYKNPKIFDKNNILAVSFALMNCNIICDDYSVSSKHIIKGSFVYLDPPYMPIKGKSNFTSYSSSGFGKKQQEELAVFFKKMDLRGAHLMLSNSYGSSEKENGEYFNKLYPNVTLKEIEAIRTINSKSDNRKGFFDLLITNY